MKTTKKQEKKTDKTRNPKTTNNKNNNQKKTKLQITNGKETIPTRKQAKRDQQTP
jgi:hypothetical protein